MKIIGLEGRGPLAARGPEALLNLCLNICQSVKIHLLIREKKIVKSGKQSLFFRENNFVNSRINNFIFTEQQNPELGQGTPLIHALHSLTGGGSRTPLCGGERDDKTLHSLSPPVTSESDE